MGKNSKFIDTYLKLRENRVGFAGGGFGWGENSPMAGGGASGLLSMGSGLVDAIDPGDQWGYRSDGGAITSGALKGASMGAALGPLGMAGGALIGGVTGLIGNNKQQQKANMAKFRHQSGMRMEARNYSMANDTAQFAEGGRMFKVPPRFMVPVKGGYQTMKFLDGGNLMEEFGPGADEANWVKEYFERPGEFNFRRGYQQFAQGGNVNKVSDTTVEFKGDNPQATDAINLGNGTYVDHNEAMVKTPAGEIIASDNLYLGGGKRSVASQIKSLQKLKNKSRSPEKRALMDYKTDVKLAQQELEAGRVDPQTVLDIAEPGGEEMEYGGLYAGNTPVDETEFFNLQNVGSKKRKPSLSTGKLNVDGTIMARVSQYCNGGRKSRYAEGGKKSEYVDHLAESENEDKEHQLEMGIEAEADEHHTSLKKGKTIAAQHLKEDSKYYTKLKKAGLKHGGKEPNMLSLPVYHEVPLYDKELDTEPGHGPGSGTFNVGGKYYDDRAKGLYKDGGKSDIHIKPSKRGSFTAWAKSRGMGVQEAAGKVMANKSNYSPGIVKKANFAKNASGWKHEDGGQPQGRYVPTEYDYLAGDSSAQTPLGIINRSEMDLFKQDPTQIPAMRNKVPDAMWKDVLIKFDDPAVQGLKLSNLHLMGPKGKEKLEYGNRIMGEWRDELAGLPEMSGLAPEMPSLSQPTMPQVRGLGNSSTAQTPNKVNAFKYQVPGGKKYKEELNAFVRNYADGGGIAPAEDLNKLSEMYAVTDPGYLDIPQFNPGHTYKPYTGRDTRFADTGTAGIGAPELPQSLQTMDVPQGGGTWADANRVKRNNLTHDFMKGAAVFGPDLINSINYLNTPNVPSPVMNRYLKLQRMNNRAQMAQIGEAGRSANKAILNRGNQLGSTMAGINANLATKMGAINQANEGLRNINTSIGNQEAAMNSRIGMMNTGLQNKFLSDQLSRQLAIRRGLSGTAANIGNKAQGLFAERDKKAMDMMALDALKAGFPSGVYDRKIESIMETYLKNRGITR